MHQTMKKGMRMNRTFANLSVGIISLFIAAQVQGQIEYEEIPDPPLSRGESIYYRYETTWGLRDDPANKYSMGPGGPFKTKEEAETSLQKKFAETKDNGFWSVTHGLITRWPYVRSAAGEDSEPDSSANETIKMPKSKITGSDLKIVDPGPSASSKKKSANELDMTGRYIELFANGKKAKVEFLENGEIRIVDANQADALQEKNNRLMAAGKRPTGQEPDVIATGKWSQTGTAVTIETKLFTYMGTINGNMLEGSRTSKGGGANENWESLIYPPFENPKYGKPKPMFDGPLSFEIVPSAEPTPSAVPSAVAEVPMSKVEVNSVRFSEDDFVGTYTMKHAAATEVMNLQKGGKCVITHTFENGSELKYEDWTWKYISKDDYIGVDERDTAPFGMIRIFNDEGQPRDGGTIWEKDGKFHLSSFSGHLLKSFSK
jgi:hypothetical protein